MYNKKILAASMAAAMAAGIAGQAQAIEVKSENVGQLLMQPLYYADSAVTSDLVVVNTRTDAAVLAKVVFRTADTSKEALDFFIYLTPGDTWRGTVIAGSQPGQGAITSTDDSMLRSATEFADAANPVTQDFQTPTALANADTGESGNSNSGHIEVIGVRSAVNGDYEVSGVMDTITVERGMAKADLRALMDPANSAITSQPSSSCGTTGTDGRSTIDPCHLQISGITTIRLSDGSNSADERASIEMTALGASNYALGNVMVNQEGDSVIGGGDSTVSNYVVSNVGYTQSLGAESSIGPRMGDAAITGDFADHTVDIEWALQAGNVSTAWESDSTATSTATFVQVTFPTKYRHAPGLSSVCEDHPSSAATEDGSPRVVDEEYSSPFQNSAVGPVPYALLTCNNSEGCNEADPDPIFSAVGEETPINQFVKEVNLEGAVVLAGAASGWNNYDLFARNTYKLGTGPVANTGVCSYTGVPSIASAMKINGGANLLWEKMGVRVDRNIPR